MRWRYLSRALVIPNFGFRLFLAGGVSAQGRLTRLFAARSAEYNQAVAGVRNREFMTDEQQRLAEAVRAACVEAARNGYEEAGLSGLCAEGRWECAVDAIRRLDLAALIRQPGCLSPAGEGGA